MGHLYEKRTPNYRKPNSKNKGELVNIFVSPRLANAQLRSEREEEEESA